ncbi:unnamed protein product [Closterium sp. NIES-64]|nr:unnamed protein product [Closterium sp. NIES-64]
MDPTAGRDRAQESTAESAWLDPPRAQGPAAPRPLAAARPSASEPVPRLERGLSLPLRHVPQPHTSGYSWVPPQIASSRPAAQPCQERGRSPPRQQPRQQSPRRRSPERREDQRDGAGDQLSPAGHRSPRRPSPRGRAGQRSPRVRSPEQHSPPRSPATRGRGSHGRHWDSGRREQTPPRPHSAGSAGRRGQRNGGGRGGNGRQQDPALDRAANTFVEVVRQAQASGGATHVHIEVTKGPPFAADPGQVAPLRAPTLREYQPAREGRAQFRTPRQVPGFSAPRLTVGRTPGWSSAFPREALTAPPPTRAGRDPMLTMCRILNLAEACEVVANLQLAAQHMVSRNVTTNLRAAHLPEAPDAIVLPLVRLALSCTASDPLSRPTVTDLLRSIKALKCSLSALPRPAVPGNGGTIRDGAARGGGAGEQQGGENGDGQRFSQNALDAKLDWLLEEEDSGRFVTDV